MNVALIGYGGMGRTLKESAVARGHNIVAIIDTNAPDATSKKLDAEALAGADVAIDFSSPDAVADTVRTCVDAGVSVVIGTTGWYDRMDDIRRLAEGKSVGVMWSSNFSIGVHLYFRIIAAAARLVDAVEEYDIWGHEIHHAGKADSPSGTAKTLEKILLNAIKRKQSVVEEKLDRKRKDSEIHFSSVRGGPVNFGHVIGFDSAADRILVTHEARSRDGYALGAVKAAEWLNGKKGFFEMDDYLRETLEVS